MEKEEEEEVAEREEEEKEEEVAAGEEVEEEAAGREATATMSPRARLRPGRGPGPARHRRATPT